MPRNHIAVIACLFSTFCITLTRFAYSEDVPAKIVVTKAVYGDLPDGAKSDVTEKVAAMVKDDGLTVDATNDNFGDPAEGIGKKLTVDYTINGVAHSKTVEENATLQISGKPSKITISKATYGDFENNKVVDVTQKVSDAIDGDTLSIAATNDNFTDPSEGVGKTLKVQYTINGVAHEKSVAENETLLISAKPSKLVIRKAVYGDLENNKSTDVTQKVAEQVNGDALSIGANNDNFGDPAEGVGKTLKVDYTFDGAEKSKSAAEGETLTISETGE